MRLDPIGEATAGCWRWLAQQYPYVEIDARIVMPNHLHGIIVLQDRPSSARPTDTIRALQRKSLGSLIGAFKTVSTHRINELRATPGAPVWQRNYFEHVIRDEASLQRIREYIAGNPGRRAEDPENPSALTAPPPRQPIRAPGWSGRPR